MHNRLRIAVPLAALAALAVCALVLAAQSGYALCGRRISLSGMPAMAMDGMAMNGMPMPPVNGVMICPIVLCLIVASALLAAATIVVAACDPDRALTGRYAVRALARLNVTRVSGLLALAALGSGIAMELLDTSTAATPASRLLLVGIALGGSFVLTVLAQTAGRLVLALGTRVWRSIFKPIAVRSNTPSGYAARLRGTERGFPALSLATRTHGLRAPPSAR
jgi:hypothetical protein